MLLGLVELVRRETIVENVSQWVEVLNDVAKGVLLEAAAIEAVAEKHD